MTAGAGIVVTLLCCAGVVLTLIWAIWYTGQKQDLRRA